MKASSPYTDPRWLNRAFEIYTRDSFICQGCHIKDRPIGIYIKFHTNRIPIWEYENGAFVSLCEECEKHQRESKLETVDLIYRALAGVGFLNGQIESFAGLLVEFYEANLQIDVGETMQAIEAIIVDSTLRRQIIKKLNKDKGKKDELGDLPW